MTCLRSHDQIHITQKPHYELLLRLCLSVDWDEDGGESRKTYPWLGWPLSLQLLLPSGPKRAQRRRKAESRNGIEGQESGAEDTKGNLFILLPSFLSFFF